MQHGYNFIAHICLQGFDALCKWLLESQHHSSITLVSLRQDPTVICNDSVYSLATQAEGDTFNNSASMLTANQIADLESELQETVHRHSNEFHKVCERTTTT